MHVSFWISIFIFSGHQTWLPKHIISPEFVKAALSLRLDGVALWPLCALLGVAPLLPGLASSCMKCRDEAKFHSPAYPTFEALVVWCAVGPCRGELGPFCGPVPAVVIAVFSSVCWAHFSDVMFRRNSERCSRSDRQHTTKQWSWPFFHSSLALGSVL